MLPMESQKLIITHEQSQGYFYDPQNLNYLPQRFLITNWALPEIELKILVVGRFE
jgi:hypothetical protein